MKERGEGKEYRSLTLPGWDETKIKKKKNKFIHFEINNSNNN